MLARGLVRGRHGLSDCCRRHLSLAYALHKPVGVDVKLENEPLVIMHGLFGSKQNNRSISKYGFLGCQFANAF